MARSAAETKAIIASGQRPRRTMPIPMRGDLAAECEDIERRIVQLELAADGASASLGGDPEARALASRIEELRAEMRDSIVVFTLRALPSKRSRNAKVPTWDQLKDSHPPRPDNKKDADNGVNMDEFNIELLRLSIVDPVLDDDDWDNLLEVLSDGTFNQLMGACYGVNQEDVDVPFSSAASQILRTLESVLNAPNGSASL